MNSFNIFNEYSKRGSNGNLCENTFSQFFKDVNVFSTYPPHFKTNTTINPTIISFDWVNADGDFQCRIEADCIIINMNGIPLNIKVCENNTYYVNNECVLWSYVSNWIRNNIPVSTNIVASGG